MPSARVVASTVSRMDRGPLRADGTRSVPMRPRLFCLPSADHLFAAIVEEVAAALPLDSPRELAAALRPMYPRISIHLRELAGEPVPTWYVYREQTFPHPGEA